MEMENSRRSLDRSREPGLKKPRSADDADRDRGLNGIVSDRDRSIPPRVPGGGQPLISARLKANERERDRDAREDSFRGASYHHHQQQQMQELVAQYKTALAELTFNSKPIITNLTIIAGENLHAAKGIAATVCANIIEVPSEQKLPSLYLLDSIVKNIGRDYIKYFAARLPEVFCKAYKQVDSSVHPGMRHLFGTWKGVFPPASLQIIEKELGFPPVINGSSSGATASRPDSQTQRPPHSIHVNPKYLEARQRLQQSTRAKVSSDDIGGAVSTAEDAGRSDRPSLIGSTRQWTDPPVKNNQHPLRELLNDPIREKKPGVGYGDLEFAPDLSWHSDLGIRKSSERLTERDTPDKQWYGAGSNASEASVDQRNGFDVDHAYGNYRPSRSALPPINQNSVNKSIRMPSRNWKNSEEEEYMWDDINSRLTDHGGTHSSMKSGWNPNDAETPASLQRGKGMPLEEHPDTLWHKLDSFPRLGRTSGGEDRVPYFREVEEHLTQAHGQQDTGLKGNIETSADSLSTGGVALGHRTPSLWPSQESPLSLAGLNHPSMALRNSSQSEGQPIRISSGVSTSLSSSLSRTGLLPHLGLSSSGVTSCFGSLANAGSGLSGMFGKQQQQPLRPVSPSAHSTPSSAPLPHQKSHSSADHDHRQPQSFSDTDQKPMQLSGQLNRVLPLHVNQDSFPVLPQNHIQQSHTLLNLQSPFSQPSQHIPNSSASLTPFTQLRHQTSFSQQSQSDLSLQQTQTQSQPSIQIQKPPPSALSFGSTQTGGFFGTSTSNNPGGNVSGQSNASDLLAAILKSGLIPNSSGSSFQDLNIQPPLPSGPPPIQVMASSTPSVPPSSALGPVSCDNAPVIATHLVRTVLPPLPPGPPPASSLVGTSSQISKTTSSNSNPISSLLSSLVAKGLISSPATEPPSITSSQMLNHLPTQGSSLDTSSSISVKSTSASLTVPSPSSVGELSLPKCSAPKGAAAAQDTTANLKEPIGIEFRPEIIREFHLVVVNGLFDDLKHQCRICGLRFELQEQLGRHLDWHASRESKPGCFNRLSRKWYAISSDWVAGNVEPKSRQIHTAVEGPVSVSEKNEPMVPADESQSLCALCGEPFEDFYCNERDEWMYRGTVYMTLRAREGDARSMDNSMAQGPIVHAKCLSRSSIDSEMAEHDKMVLGVETDVLSQGFS